MAFDTLKCMFGKVRICMRTYIIYRLIYSVYLQIITITF